MTGSLLRIEQTDDGVTWINLHRPERHNAQNPALWAEFAEVGTQLSGNDTVRVIVIAGDGPSFSSGIDLIEITEPDGFIQQLAAHPPGDPDPMLAAVETAQDTFRWIRSAPKPVIAAVHGNALGAGMQLALACDVRFVADDSRLGLLEVVHGLLPDMGATAWLRDVVSAQVAKDLVFTGRKLTGVEAAGLGIALRSVPVDQLRSTVADYAKVLAGRSATSLAWSKLALTEIDEERSIRLSGMGQAACIRQVFTPTEQT